MISSRNVPLASCIHTPVAPAARAAVLSASTDPPENTTSPSPRLSKRAVEVNVPVPLGGGVPGDVGDVGLVGLVGVVEGGVGAPAAVRTMLTVATRLTLLLLAMS